MDRQGTGGGVVIFKPILIERILAGEKTVTRRPVNGDKPCAYEPGKTYSIQPGMARPTVARIRIESVERQALGDLSTFGDDEAKREGFERWEDFYEYWRGLYGRVIPWDLPVWRIEFVVVEEVARICPQCSGRGVTGIGKKLGAYRRDVREVPA